VLVDKLHQELLFLGIDLVNVRHDGPDNRHDRLGGQKGLCLNLVMKRQNRDVIASGASMASRTPSNKD
jgi:hypothetical protein